MHDEDPGPVNWFLPTKREVFRAGVFFIGDFTNEAHYWWVFRLNDAGDSSTAGQLLALLKCCDVTCWSIDNINVKAISL